MNKTIPFPADPRTAFAIRSAFAFLQELEIQVLPADPFSIAYECGWRIHSYSAASDHLQLSLNEFRASSAMREAFTVYRRKPVIFYDDVRLNRDRILFSLCHEFGHIVLKHFADFRYITLNDAQLQLLDREASIFAANLLAPPAVVHAISPEKRQRCRKIFGMSQAAWQHRLSSLEADLSVLTNEQQALQLKQFDRWMHAVRCRDCGISFHHAGHTACPHCGGKRFVWQPHSAAAHVISPIQHVVPIPRILTNTVAKGRILTAELENPMILE